MESETHQGEEIVTNQRWAKAENLALALIGIMVLGALVALFYNFFFARNVADWRLTILSGIASSLLSLALILIYYRMSKTQIYMSSIQRQENDILRKANSPQISVDELRYKGDGNLFHLTLSNLGKGSAQNLKLSINPELCYWDGEVFELKSTDDWELYHDDAILTKQIEEKEGTVVTSCGDYIEKGRIKEVFEVELEFDEITDGRLNHERNLPPIKTSSLLKKAILEKTVNQEHEHAEEFNRFNRSGWTSESINDAGEHYSVDTLQTLANDIKFNRLRLRFILKYTDETGTQTVKDIADIIAPVAVDMDEDKIWEFSYPYSEYQSRSRDYSFNMGMDPIEEDIQYVEYATSQRGNL